MVCYKTPIYDKSCTTFTASTPSYILGIGSYILLVTILIDISAYITTEIKW